MSNAEATERFWIRGNVGSAVFPGWIARHAARLGLQGQVISQETSCVTVVLSGPADLLDAMALGCSLGPQEIWVDDITRKPEKNSADVNCD